MVTIFADLRCFQEPETPRRGIAHHAFAVLRQRPEDFEAVGLFDETRRALPADCTEIASRFSCALSAPAPSRGAIFLDCSPMMHGPV